MTASFLCHLPAWPSLLLLGKGGNSSLSSCREAISSSAKAVDELITGPSSGGIAMSSGLQLPCLQSIMATRDELHSTLQSLTTAFNEQGGGESQGSSSEKSTEDGTSSKESFSTRNTFRNQIVIKNVGSLPPGVLPNGNPHWVWLTSVLILCVTVCFMPCCNAGFALNTCHQLGEKHWHQPHSHKNKKDMGGFWQLWYFPGSKHSSQSKVIKLCPRW